MMVVGLLNVILMFVVASYLGRVCVWHLLHDANTHSSDQQYFALYRNINTLRKKFQMEMLFFFIVRLSVCVERSRIDFQSAPVIPNDHKSFIDQY